MSAIYSSPVLFTDEEIERAKRIFNYIHSNDPLTENDKRLYLFSKYQTSLVKDGIKKNFCRNLLDNPEYNHIL